VSSHPEPAEAMQDPINTLLFIVCSWPMLFFYLSLVALVLVVAVLILGFTA
jgi:hypothetical protein